MADVNPIPEGYPQVIPYLCVEGAAEAIDFYTNVFGARERVRMPGPDGKIAHAELEIGDSVIMLSDEDPNFGNQSPKTIGGTPVIVSVYVEDVDDVFNKAVNAGATGTREPEDQFYGDRAGQFEDPFGHRWSVATHIEDVSPEEMERRMNEMMGGGDGGGGGDGDGAGGAGESGGGESGGAGGESGDAGESSGAAGGESGGGGESSGAAGGGGESGSAGESSGGGESSDGGESGSAGESSDGGESGGGGDGG